MAKEQTFLRERQRTNLKEPRRYKVTIYNDDFTTMEFVVRVLTEVFFKSRTDAETLMMTVHKSDKAVVGIYTYDIAVSKVQKATQMARSEGFPLRLTYEPE
jgi:ATP-dependent Clp protease adaptor protein ClpS